jgi:hypothetical protein
MSEKSPFKGQDFIPRPFKSKKKEFKLSLPTTKEINRDRVTGRKKGLIYTRPRWRLYFGVYFLISRTRELAQAVKEFGAKYPRKKITRITMITDNGTAYKRGAR